MEKTRNHLLDNLKGMLIFLVVFAHFILLYAHVGVASLSEKIATFFIYSFHIPLFAFISGYFSKNIDKIRETAFSRLLLFPKEEIFRNNIRIKHCCLVSIYHGKNGESK